jgi:hypothetical protein
VLPVILYGSTTLIKNADLSFENRVLKRISGPKIEGKREGWESERPFYLYSSPRDERNKQHAWGHEECIYNLILKPKENTW